ncbi:Dihydrolipoamide acyltransferase component of branched-chain alpha-keto acid dehydrogenase complex, partial [hydrothermal vent metagenome]
MGQYNFKLPDLGEGIVESEVAALHVKVGDMVKEDQPLIDMMTDKATVEIPSPVDGKVVSISGNPGDMIAVGAVMVTFEIEGEAVEEKPEPEKMEPAVATPVQVAEPIKTVPSDKPLASPAVRLRALEQDIDLSQVPG